MGIQVQPCCCVDDECGCTCADYSDDFSGALSGDWNVPAAVTIVTDFGTPDWATAGGKLVQSDDSAAGSIDLPLFDVDDPPDDTSLSCCVSMVMGKDVTAGGSVKTQINILDATNGSSLTIDISASFPGINNIFYQVTETPTGGSTGSVDSGILFTGEFKFTWKIVDGTTARLCIDDVNVFEWSIGDPFGDDTTLHITLGATEESYWDDLCVSLGP